MKKDGIWVMMTISTTMNTMGMVMENVIEYSAVGVNMVIEDKVFEVR